MYVIKDFNANSISINGLLYSKNHNAIQASPGPISIVSISDEDDILLFNEPVTNVMIADKTYPNEREFIKAFETLKKSDASGGGTTADIVDAINSLKDTLIEKSDETQQAIEDLKTDTNIINGVVNNNLIAGQTASVNIDFIGLISTENYNVEVKHNYGQSVTMIGQVVENNKVNVQITPQTLLVAPINFDVHVKQNLI